MKTVYLPCTVIPAGAGNQGVRVPDRNRHDRSVVGLLLFLIETAPLPGEGNETMTLIKKSQPKERPCIICGKFSHQTICPTCEAHVRGEAIEKKTGVEKKGRTEQGRQ